MAHTKTAATSFNQEHFYRLSGQKPSTLEIRNMDPHFEKHLTAHALLVGNRPSGSVVPRCRH